MSLINLIKAYRKKQGLTQMRLAVLANVSLPTIQTIESGRANPTVKILEKIFGVLNCSLRVTSIKPNWNLLEQSPLPTAKQFAENTLLTLDYLEQHKEDERLKDSLIALLVAVKTHYPSFFLYFLDNDRTRSFLQDNKTSTGRIIKLSRIELDRVAKIL